MYGGRDTYRRPPPPMDPYGRGGYGGYGGGLGFDCNMDQFLPLVVFCSLLIGLILFTVGFSTNYWLESDTVNMGLWRSCAEGASCVNLVGDDNPDFDWFTATQALLTITMIFYLLSLGLLLYWVCSRSRYFFIKAVIMVLLFLSFLFLLVGVGVFGGNYDEDLATFDLEWSFYMVCVAPVLVLIGIVFLACIESREYFPQLGGLGGMGGMGRGLGGMGGMDRGLGGMDRGGYGGYKDRFGFGGGLGSGRAPPPPPPRDLGLYGGGSPYSGGTLPFTSRY